MILLRRTAIALIAMVLPLGMDISGDGEVSFGAPAAHASNEGEGRGGQGNNGNNDGNNNGQGNGDENGDDNGDGGTDGAALPSTGQGPSAAAGTPATWVFGLAALGAVLLASGLAFRRREN